MSDDLVAFLRDRLDEKEATAQKILWMAGNATAHGEWTAHYGYNLPASELRAGDQVIAVFPALQPAQADGEWAAEADVSLAAAMASFARHLAGQMLREVEAKRDRLQRYLDADRNATERRAAGNPSPAVETMRDTLYVEVLHDAAVYSDHPDYRQEWKP